MSSPDQDLSDLLQGWSPRVEPGMEFRRSVWARIASEDREADSFYQTFLGWIPMLCRPRVATATIAAALLGGILIGGLQARSAAEERYLLSLNPTVAASTAR